MYTSGEFVPPRKIMHRTGVFCTRRLLYFSEGLRGVFFRYVVRFRPRFCTFKFLYPVGPGSGDSLCDLLRKFGRFCTNQLDSTVGRSQQKSSWTGSWGLGEQGFWVATGSRWWSAPRRWATSVCANEMRGDGNSTSRGWAKEGVSCYAACRADLGRGSVLRIIVTVALSSPIIARDEHAHAALFACVLHILSITGMKTRPR
jgi:hypothetical protein